MTDDPLDRLKNALERHTPEPSDKARDAALRAAAENFEARAQGSTREARPTPDRPRAAGVLKGVKTMLTHLSRPQILMGTSALATLALAVALSQGLLRQTSTSTPDFLSDATEEGETPEPRQRDMAKTAAPEAELQRLVSPKAAPALAPEPRMAESDAAPPPPPAAQSGLKLSAGRALNDEAFAPAPIPAEPLRIVPPESDTEQYPQAEPNPLKLVADAPVSTFSIDVDTASYALVRSSLDAGQMPPKDAVRVEEMINYFDYAYPAPEDRAVPFRTSVSVAPTPWNPDTKLMQIGIRGWDVPAAERPPLNLVFLIDTSGSMDDPRKLPLLKQSFELLLDTLRPEDSVAIVTYAGSAGMALEPTPASDKVKILGSLDRLSAGGSTAGQAGLQQAYDLAERMGGEGEISRVILATDGDFNVGLSDPKALKDFVAEKRDSGAYLSVLGFGRGNYDDATMQALAQNGNGTASYIDTLAEAQKVLVEDVAGALVPIADDVKIQVEFNPAQVSEYRLIGYETRGLAREDFNDDTVDAGEIGSGHMVTALYEITPKGSPAERIGGLRYQQAAEPEAATDPSGEYAFLKLRYKLPGEDTSHLIETPVTPDRQDIAPQETDFAAAVAGFGRLLRGEDLPGGWSYDEALKLAAASRGEDPYGYRSELLRLIRIADALDR